MFLEFLNKWLEWRYVQQMGETRSFHRFEVEKIPAGYYAVVSVELKPIDEIQHPLEVEKELVAT